MKKMISSMKTLVALLMVGATVTSCSSDDTIADQPVQQPAGPQVYTMTVEATKGGDGTRALTDAGSTLTATWATTENVYVKKVDTWATGSLKPQADGATATLKGELSGVTIAANDVLTLQFPRSGALDYTGQVGTLEDIAAKYDYATATVTVKSVSGGDIIPEAATTTFQNQQAIVKFTLVDKANTSTKLSPTALTINDGTSDILTLTSIPGATYTTNSAGVLYVALPAVDSKPITLTATVGSDTYTLTTSSSKSFDNGSYYRVTAQMTKQAAAPAGPEAVDLGLPSGTKWANMNVGATSESDYGDFFAWGETTGYSSVYADPMTDHDFSWANYNWSAGSKDGFEFSKYTGSDNKTTLEAADDAATANWGVDWRMPTMTEFEELLYDTDKEWVTDYNGSGVSGYKFTSKTDASKSIFLPAAGWRQGTSLNYQGFYGIYWSSSLYESGPYNAWALWFASGYETVPGRNRYYGYSVRPVQ